jgi:integrase
MAALEMRASSKWWYGRFQHDGKTHCKNLGIQIEGSRPKSLRLEGDATFEQSRGQARMAMEELIRQVKAPQSRSTLTKAVYQATAAYEAQTGSTVKQVAISELPDYWASIPRKRPPAPRYASQCKSVLNEFVRFVAENAPGTTKAHLVTRELALNYLKAQQERGMTAKTWNDRLKLLRSTFKHLPDLPDNPFANIPEREVETVFREPYSPEEIEDILAASTQEKVVRPVIITALCTAMRLGDCATLEWSSVDLEDGFITVKTSKTRATVDIPLFPMLFDEIQSRVGNGAQYVFPEAAEIYLPA